PSLGTVTGAGTVSPSDQLAFKLKADIGGLGAIPIDVTGTTSDPHFLPDMKGMASGLLKGAMSGKVPANPASSITGMFGKKKPQ
ncbi:MAG: hypothetical protein WBV69_09100, partial [Candidatus Sulfotelmatobacter sp.]